MIPATALVTESRPAEVGAPGTITLVVVEVTLEVHLLSPVMQEMAIAGTVARRARERNASINNLMYPRRRILTDLSAEEMQWGFKELELLEVLNPLEVLVPIDSYRSLILVFWIQGPRRR